MVYPYDLFRAGAAAVWVVVFLWVTVFSFWFTRRLFPGRSIKHAFFLWLIVWAQAAWTLTRLPPHWVLSVFFLMPVSFLDAEAKPGHIRVFSREVPRYFFERALGGSAFVIFVMVMVFVREAGEKKFGIRLFEQPAGPLFVAAGMAFLWKKTHRFSWG